MLQKLSAIVLGVATSVLPITIMAGDDPKKEFVNALKGQTVVLKHDVYTIHYVSAKGGTQTMRSRVAGVLTVSPGREAPYYQADFVGMGMMADSDQQKLVDKVSMRMASGTGNWLSGDQTATRSTAGAKLMKYDARSRMKVKDVRFDDDTVIVELWDEFTTKGDPTTAVNIKMPSRISKEFAEREEVQKQLARVLLIGSETTTASK